MRRAYSTLWGAFDDKRESSEELASFPELPRVIERPLLELSGALSSTVYYCPKLLGVLTQTSASQQLLKVSQQNVALSEKPRALRVRSEVLRLR